MKLNHPVTVHAGYMNSWKAECDLLAQWLRQVVDRMANGDGADLETIAQRLDKLRQSIDDQYLAGYNGR